MAGGSLSLLKLACVIMALAAHPAQAAMTCGTVAMGIAPCIAYLKGGAVAPPAPCCSGVRRLKAMAMTVADRQAVCSCLKSAASRTSGLQPRNAVSLPGKCGIRISFAVSIKTDCSRVR